MERKRKKYFYEDNTELTDYIKRKIRRCLKEEKNEMKIAEEFDIDNDNDDNKKLQVKLEETFPSDAVLSIQYEDHEKNWNKDDLEIPYSNDDTEDSDSNNDIESFNDINELFTNKENLPFNSINNLLHEREFMESIQSTVTKNSAELLLMTLELSLKCCLSLTNITNLLKFVNIICNKKVVPETRYYIDQLCNSDEGILLHAMCSVCSKILGTFVELNDFVTCSNCETEVNVSNPSNPCYFVIIDPSNSVRDYLEIYQDYYDYVVKKRIHEKNSIQDIYDGKLYRNFLKSLDVNDRYAYATAICNTDGAPVFECTNYSIYPIYLMLNEIPPNERLKNIILVGLWYGPSKPEMSAYLETFVKCINELLTATISCTIKGEKRNVKLFVIHSSVDTVARCTMNGTVQFNGKYGCDWCLQKGTYFSGSMRYPYLEKSAKDRDRTSIIKYAKKALKKKKPIKGVKTASPLLLLNNFNIIEGFSPDYLHCVLAGVTLQLTEYILNKLSPADLDLIDTLLLNIKVPHQVARSTRKLSDRGYWKAREWENWLLYYSIPILDSIIKNKHLLKHWSLLVDSIHLLLKSDIQFQELNKAKYMLEEFVRLVEELYSLQAMTYNVHQLLHLCKSVYNWGPLWAHSTFPFESANHYLLSAIQCGKGVISQVIRYHNLQRIVKVLKHSIDPDYSKTIIEYCENLHASKPKNTFKISTIVYFGKSYVVSKTFMEKLNVSKRTKMFKRSVINGCLFTACKQRENLKSCNYIAQLRNQKYVQILYFLIDEESSQEVTVCQSIRIRSSKYSEVINEITSISSDIISVKTSEIFKPCIIINNDKKMYIVPVPNILCYS